MKRTILKLQNTIKKYEIMKKPRLQQIIIFFIATIFTISCDKDYLHIPDTN